MPLDEYPAKHVQVDEPVLVAELPDGQVVHDVPLTLYVPAAHAVHVRLAPEPEVE